MSLNWRVGNIADYKTRCWRTNEHGEEVLHYITEALIWWTLKVGIPVIKDEATAQKFFDRMETRKDQLGERGDIYEAGVKRDVTLDEVTAHIGLATNGDRWDDAKFQKIIQGHLDEAERYRRRTAKLKAKQVSAN